MTFQRTVRSVPNAAPVSTNRRTVPSWPSVPQVGTERGTSVHKQEDGTIMAVCATGLYRTRSQRPQTGGRHHHGRLCHRGTERGPSVHKQEDGTIMAVCATGQYRTRSQRPQTGGRHHHGRLCHRSVPNAAPASTNRRTVPSWLSVPQVCTERGPSVHKQEDGTIMAVCATGLY